VPPLREREGDIPLLAKHILRRLSEQAGVAVPALQPTTLEALTDYDFPGNVRELENVLERAIALCENGVIEPADLMLESAGGHEYTDDDPDLDSDESADVESLYDEGNGGVALDDYISNIERDAIIKALKETRYNKTAAAKKLGITFRALWNKLKKLGFDCGGRWSFRRDRAKYLSSFRTSPRSGHDPEPSALPENRRPCLGSTRVLTRGSFGRHMIRFDHDRVRHPNASAV
jgi:DNA-binding NtrC family response regulator